MFEPKKTDVDWILWVNEVLNDGGFIAFPSTHLIYRVEKQSRRWVLINPKQLEDPESRGVHEKTLFVLAKIGWLCTIIHQDNGHEEPGMG